MVDLRVIANLLAVGIARPAVRKAARYLRVHFADVVRPLARLALQTDGKRVLVQTTDKKHLVDATAEGQVVIAVAVAPIVQDLRSRVAELRAPQEIDVRVRGRSYRAVLTPDLEAGGFTIEVPELPADSVSHARAMTTDAIELWLASRAESTKRRAAK